ncbi:glycoside hydrolase family 65 central catalytic [Spirochaeta thermophila DSM 6578]|uniref:Glycoside hydrolase family 65 central catalytic n=1 Tax=Winmispira thermophila (strain ATCC 700085 / DSM 6578 / Z-1203) TaxID=869211 RepID=G0GAT1_WINT7|nr:glycosyl hydrolase family 65 protein [Spirochaeta thermophila]AEJ61827.1 glycoside hydrolase family 65 central catalytic [Spirochaeta thermophila DSM 6578]
MAKVADRYLVVDPWKVIEEGFHPDRSMVSESLFSLANEYMGVRGYLEEGASCASMRGSYFNGVYEVEQEGETGYRGIVTTTHFMVNGPDWLDVRVEADGEVFDVAKCNVTSFRRVLHLDRGLLERSLVWETQSGGVVEMRFVRFLHREVPQRAYHLVEVRGLRGEAAVRVWVGHNGRVVHYSRKKCYWEGVRSGGGDGVVGLLVRTVGTEQRVFTGSVVEVEGGEVSPVVEDMRVGFVVEGRVREGGVLRVKRYVHNLVEKRAEVDDGEVWRQGMTGLGLQREEGFEGALQAVAAYWERVWKRYDVRIEGDPLTQQGIRLCIFHLLQTYQGQDPSHNVGAKGLTGEAYNGHAFWDTETYCLPFYLLTNVKAARNLLEFRHRTLPQARKRAVEVDCRGACYPVATLNGDEACTLWQHSNLQLQPSTGVAYAIWHYLKVTGDLDFLYDYGVEMLVEISRFLVSRGDYSQRSGLFGFYGVMGPDEFHMMVNNNCYTNFMAKKTFEFTLWALDRMAEDQPDRYRELVERLGFSDEERKEFAVCAEKMIIPYDEKTGVFEQHEGFFDLPHIDIDEIPVTDFPLYSHWSYDRIYRYDMIKQPDVLMFLFLYNREFSLECKRANYDYYDPRTVHESSLSPAIHSILAAELGREEEAYRLFGFATRLDLDNYNRNTHEGLHLTSMAAAWLNIVYGFGGLRTDGDRPALAPMLPSAWKSYSFSFGWRDARIGVEVGKEGVRLRLLEGERVELELYGEPAVLTEEGLVRSFPDKGRPHGLVS